jgi:AcrR family transcriptional regulator
MTPRLTPERRRELNREALLDAATTVFAREGYAAGRLEEIAESAGFTTGAIYSNFGNKQELFLEVIARRNARLLEAYRQKLQERPGGQVADLGQVAQVWTEHELGDRDALLLTLEVRLAALRDPQIRARVADFEQQTEQTIAEFIGKEIEATDGLRLPMAADQFAALVYAANQGIVQHAAICTTDHRDLFRAFLEILTSSLSS